MSERCELMDLPKNMCAHCLGHLGREVQLNNLTTITNWFDVRWANKCCVCTEEITMHSRGRFLIFEDDDRRVIHDECTEDAKAKYGWSEDARLDSDH